MLNNLFTTILICLGVANTTPISNYENKESKLVLTTPKKENITSNYTLNLQQTGINELYLTQTETTTGMFGNPFVSYVRDRENTAKETGHNNYINVIGSVYQTNIYTYEADQTTQVGNSFIDYSHVEQDDNYQFAWATQIAFVYKITTYNFNINTSIRIRTNITMNAPYVAANFIENIWIRKQVLTINNDNRLDSLLGRQIVKHQAYNIYDEITNVNNGFYYTLNTTMYNQNTSTLSWGQKTFDTTINLLPNQDNYLILIFSPVLKDQYQTTPTDNNKVIQGNGYFAYTGTGATITGTNIIPDGTFEVVDIPGLMYEVIGMPFAFVSQAFNLTLFPGTPYQINIANLFLSIIAVIVFVWLITIFIKMKSGG